MREGEIKLQKRDKDDCGKKKLKLIKKNVIDETNYITLYSFHIILSSLPHREGRGESFLIISLQTCYLLLEALHLLLFKDTFVLDRNDLDELVDVVVPVVEHTARQRRTCI